MKKIYLITLNTEVDKDVFIQEYITGKNITITNKYPTIPTLISIECSDKDIYKINHSSKVKNTTRNDFNPDSCYDIAYDDKFIVYQDGDLPNVGVEGITLTGMLHNKYLPYKQYLQEESAISDLNVVKMYIHETALSSSYSILDRKSELPRYISYGSRSDDYDHTLTQQQLIDQNFPFFITDNPNLLPKSYGTWRITVPKEKHAGHDKFIDNFTSSIELYPTDQFPDGIPGDFIPAVNIEGSVNTTAKITRGELTTQIIPLNYGFNQISCYVDTVGRSVYDIFIDSLYDTTTNQYVSRNVIESEFSPVESIRHNIDNGFISFTSRVDSIGEWDISNSYIVKIHGGNDNSISSGYELRIQGFIHDTYEKTYEAGTYQISVPSTTPIPVTDIFTDSVILDAQAAEARLEGSNSNGIKDINANATVPSINVFGVSELIPGQGYTLTLLPGVSISIQVSNEVDIPGCTVLEADNFNPRATVDDGSCVIYGCTDFFNTNYNPLATIRDDSCVLQATQTIPIYYGWNYISTYVDMNTQPFSNYTLGQLFDNNFFSVSDINQISEQNLLGGVGVVAASQLSLDAEVFTGTIWSSGSLIPTVKFENLRGVGVFYGYNNNYPNPEGYLHLVGDLKVIEEIPLGSSPGTSFGLPVLSKNSITLDSWFAYNETFDSLFKTRINSILELATGNKYTPDAPAGITELTPGRLYFVNTNEGGNIARFPNNNVVPGCTNKFSENYNPDATVDDGSCLARDASQIEFTQVIPLPTSDLDTTQNTFYISIGVNTSRNPAEIFTNSLFIQGESFGIQPIIPDNQYSSTLISNIIQKVTQRNLNFSSTTSNLFTSIHTWAPSAPETFVSLLPIDSPSISSTVFEVTLNPKRDTTKRYQLRIAGTYDGRDATEYTFNIRYGDNYISIPWVMFGSSTNVDIADEYPSVLDVFYPYRDNFSHIKEMNGNAWIPGINEVDIRLLPGRVYLLKSTNEFSVTVTRRELIDMIRLRKNNT